LQNPKILLQPLLRTSLTKPDYPNDRGDAKAEIRNILEDVR
jgi:hypothetical protein